MEKDNIVCSDMDLIMEMLNEDDTKLHEDTINIGEPPAYYQSKAINILNQFNDIDNYFIFIKTILRDYHKLSKGQKEEMIQLLNIPSQIIIKEKIIQPKKKKKNTKPRLNTNDDY